MKHEEKTVIARSHNRLTVTFRNSALCPSVNWGWWMFFTHCVPVNCWVRDVWTSITSLCFYLSRLVVGKRVLGTAVFHCLQVNSRMMDVKNNSLCPYSQSASLTLSKGCHNCFKVFFSYYGHQHKDLKSTELCLGPIQRRLEVFLGFLVKIKMKAYEKLTVVMCCQIVARKSVAPSSGDFRRRSAPR